MQYLCWICWLFWAGLPTLLAYPISSISTDSQHGHTSFQWEHTWILYTIGLFSVTVTAFTLVGCLCCRRNRRPKGFQDTAERSKQEFKDGNSIGPESSFEHTVEGLELNVPCVSISERVQFEPLPVDKIVSGAKLASKPKSLPLSATFYEESNADSSALREPCREWFEAKELSVPREKLKYLREIGHGWFGKVVEGRADLDEPKSLLKSGGVVVRILSEEATTKEKAWFLGEATPYLRLRHQNVLSLLGFCLETDPYLLLFESCPVGDLKGFLVSNKDVNSQEALKKENVPIRIAMDVATGLKHMHDHAFVHTDLSARNCLVASDLSVKLGDYGIGVEKYPNDYYVVGDRALPIRWSAPESIVCTDTTMETREITSQANMWSYAILLWEILTWGERPYNDMTDEQVIQMLLSLRTDTLPNGTHILQSYIANSSSNILQIIRLCLDLNPNKRPTLGVVKQILLDEQLEYIDFDQRWDNLRTSTSKHVRSASLQDLRGSIDSDYWTTIVEDIPHETLQSSFRLGPDEPVKSIPGIQVSTVHHESGSETEEESWKGRIEQGVYSEKVKQKSKSVTDLMVLVHIDLDSDADLSLGAQVSEKHVKKKLPATGSDSDLINTVHAAEFDEALRKLRNPLPTNASSKTKLLDSSERPNLLTLTTDQGQAPILRLSLDDKQSVGTNPLPVADTNTDSTHNDMHVLRLLSKGDPNFPLLRYVPDQRSLETNVASSEVKCDNEPVYGEPYTPVNNVGTSISDAFSINNMESGDSNLVDVIRWNHALDSVLEQKRPGFSDKTEFNQCTENLTNHSNDGMSELIVNTASTSDIERLRTDYSVYNADDELSNGDDAERKSVANNDEEERKQLCTPDDEQSSDSGFRDKESCEEEENCCQPSAPEPSVNDTAVSAVIPTEEEQLQILLELDTILDAEYYSTLSISERTTDDMHLTAVKNTSAMHCNEGSDCTQVANNAIENVVETEENSNPEIIRDVKIDFQADDSKENSTQRPMCFRGIETKQDAEELLLNGDKLENNSRNKHKRKYQKETENEIKCEKQNETENQNDVERECENEIEYQEEGENDNENENENENEIEIEYQNEDEDSSTMSLRSDNSYVSFGMDEEFVTAIRNELREKLPCAQMSVIEPLESHDDDNPSISSDADNKQWDDDDDGDEASNQCSGGVGISIRYNIYGTPLSPILEERESTLTSESLMSNSHDASVASKETAPSEDVLLVDTRTNKMILLEELVEKLQDDDRDTTNDDISEDENLDYNCSTARLCDDKPHIMIASGGAPLPSPEEEQKWQQLPTNFPLPLPLPLQDDLISTSFASEPGWGGSQDEDDEDEDEDEEEDEDNSSSSGEFVWKRYGEQNAEQLQLRSGLDNGAPMVDDGDIEDETDVEDEEEEEEFTPSAWNATLAPHRSALRSPDKTLKSGDQKKSVWFKKQRYHCVYEYPKETLTTDNLGDATTTWEPTSYADWEEMMDEPRLDLYPLDYDEANHTGNEEFFVSSSNRPFQFQTGDSKYVSQFFPGAGSSSAYEDRDEVDVGRPEERQEDRQEDRQNNIDLTNDYGNGQQHQLGELRHTRDRLKLNLSANGTTLTPLISVKQVEENYAAQQNVKEREATFLNENIDIDQCDLPNSLNDNTLPKVPGGKNGEGICADPTSIKNAQCDSQEDEPSKKCSVLARD